MRTEQLILLLSEDSTIEARSIERGMAAAVVASVAFLAVATIVFLGLRTDLGAASGFAPVAAKVGVMLSLASGGSLLVVRMSRPGTPNGWAPALLAGGLVLLVAWIMYDLSRSGTAGLVERTLGTSWARCLATIPVLAALPFVSLLLAARRGAVTRPGRAGAMAGLAAATLSGSVYALYCTEDSPLFVAAWYGLAAVTMMGFGAMAFRRFVRW
jgi:hypothetical protein